MLLNKRELVGFLVAPAMGPLTYYLVISWPNFFEAHGNPFDGFLVILAIGLPISYFISALIGIPILKIFQKLNFINFGSLSIGAGVIAVLPFILSELYNGTLFNSIKENNFFPMEFFISGLVVGVCFWFISIKFKKSSGSD
jgi:hypothetical protein